MSLLLWWKFGDVKKALLAGKGALYDAQSKGDKYQFTVLHILTVLGTTYTISEVAKGADAWPLIEADPGAVSACLTCANCGFHHVIRAHFRNGMEKMTSCPFGRFEGNHGRWHAEWFALHSYEVKELTVKDSLTCQSCNTEDPPIVRLY